MRSLSRRCLHRPSPSPSPSSLLFPSPSHSLPRPFPFSHPFSTHIQPPLRKKVTIVDLHRLYLSHTPITMVTAYTYPSAVHVDNAGIDILLVGDSLGMVELGYETTLPVTLDEMLHHAKAVSRGADTPLLIADLPFGSYEGGEGQAHATAVRFLKEAGMDAVKVEGGRTLAPTIAHLVASGIAVMGHIGLTPQHISTLGGFRAQGKTNASALSLLHDALALQEAGVFAIVVECTPAIIPALLSSHLSIPLIGIGAGPHTQGQVLVYHDLLGFFQHAHHAKVTPGFVKRYGRVGEEIQRGLEDYAREVREGIFPGMEFSPYKMGKEEVGGVEGLKGVMEEEARRWKERRGRGSGGEVRKPGRGVAADDEVTKVY